MRTTKKAGNPEFNRNMRMPFARGGYDVIVDGIIEPWFLEPWVKTVQQGYEVHYIILRATKKETLHRVVERTKLDKAANTKLIESMCYDYR